MSESGLFRCVCLLVVMATASAVTSQRTTGRAYLEEQDLASHFSLSLLHIWWNLCAKLLRRCAMDVALRGFGTGISNLRGLKQGTAHMPFLVVLSVHSFFFPNIPML